jgi:hypothetical protein
MPKVKIGYKSDRPFNDKEFLDQIHTKNNFKK